MSVIESAQAIQPHLVEIRRDLHRHPETSYNEAETMGRIVKELEEIGGWKLRTEFAGIHGVLAELSGPVPGKKVALRADMDALSITEETGLPYASENPGVMHACGHDFHMTMLLGAARLLKEYQKDIRGTVQLMFQPAEEKNPTGGAKPFIKAGALDGVDAVFGMHVWPNLPAGILGVRDGEMMAASDHFSITITGKPSHGAQPDQGVDALVCGAQFVTAVQTVVSRNRNPMKAGVITIGVCRAGDRYNIVPGSCYLEGTCRTYDPALRELCEKRIKEILQGVCMAGGCEGTIKYEHGWCALINTPKYASYMRKTQEKLFGAGTAVMPADPAMTAEDFAFYLTEKPGCFGWLGTTPEGGEVWPLHSSHYAPDESVLCRGAALFTQLVLDFEQE